MIPARANIALGGYISLDSGGSSSSHFQVGISVWEHPSGPLPLWYITVWTYRTARHA